MVDDKTQWAEVKSRVSSKMTNADYKTMCKLHAKYFNHKYSEPCTCNKQILRQWIRQLDEKLL